MNSDNDIPENTDWQESNVVTLFWGSIIELRTDDILWTTWDLTALVEALWLKWNQDLKTQESHIIGLILTGKEYLDPYTKYTEKLESIINNFHWESYSKLQIALLIKKADIFQKWGNIERCLEELSDAQTYAKWMGFDKLAGRIAEHAVFLNRK